MAAKHPALSSTKDAALLILSWTKEVSEVFPPLKVAVCGALAIAETADRFHSNKEDWRELALDIAKEISSLQYALNKSDGDQDSRRIRSEIEEKIEAFASELSSIEEEIKQLASRSLFQRVIQTREDQ